jgi:hypothetical protein
VNLIGARVDVRADSALVRVFYRGALIKIQPRQAPGRRVTDADDLPAERTVYAMRDLDHLRRLATAEGPAIGSGDRIPEPLAATASIAPGDHTPEAA